MGKFVASVYIQQPEEDTCVYFKKVSKPGTAIDIGKKDWGTSALKRLFSMKAKRKERETSDNGKLLYLQDDYARMRISDVSADFMVELPEGTALQEWLATFSLHFFNHLNQLYGVVSEYCVTGSCPVAMGPNSVQYTWVDDKGKKFKYAAQQYIDSVMMYTQKVISDEQVFPTKFGHVFPASFDATVRKLYRLQNHVLGHLYHSHFNHLLELGLVPHLNSLAIHFLTFIKHFNLVDEKEFEPMVEIYRKLRELSESGQVQVTCSDSKGSFSSGDSVSSCEQPAASSTSAVTSASCSATDTTADLSMTLDVTASISELSVSSSSPTEGQSPRLEIEPAHKKNGALHTEKLINQANGHTRNKSST